jgi:bifunctional DNase/RNase
MEARVSLAESEWIVMQLRGLLLDPTHDVPVLILRAVTGQLLLPIWIGLPEANAIAMALENVRTPRPMTHDLLRSCVESLGATLERVEIWGLLEGTFHARLRLRQNGPEPIEVDTRPSDAIALAVRTSSPIWVARTVLEAALSAELATEASDDEKLRAWLERARPEDLGKYKM